VSFALADIEQHREGLIVDFELEDIEEVAVCAIGGHLLHVMRHNQATLLYFGH
jgi:hypothetical protein